MKYCRRCNMLLEDKLEICIGCGNDVSTKDGYTKYPVNMQDRIDREAIEDKKKWKSIVTIILLCVVMVGLIAAIILFLGNSQAVEPVAEDKYESDFTKRLTKFMSAANEESEAKNDAQADKEAEIRAREIRDDIGTYYMMSNVHEEDNRDIFRTIIPEDLSQIEYSTNNKRVDYIYPAVFSFVATNEENTAKFTYMSPQHYVGLAVDGSRKDDCFDDEDMITYYTLKDGKSYLETLIAQGYRNARSIELTKTIPIEAEEEKRIKEYLSEYENDGFVKLFERIGLGDDVPDYEVESKVDVALYYYDIVDSSNNNVHCIFYVPIVYNKYSFTFNNSNYEISDYYIMAVESFEAGSPTIYEWYRDGFDLFYNNSKLMDDYFKVKSDSESFKPAYLLGYKILELAPFSTKEFLNGEYRILCNDNLKQMFLNEEKACLYATTDETEYPGKEYLILWEDK